MYRSLAWRPLLLLLCVAALTQIPTTCIACDHCRNQAGTWHAGYRYFDGTTLAAWYRTWHGPYALATPLRGYYVPRTPGNCDFEHSLPGDCGTHGASGCSYPPVSSVGFEPVQFERLGKIPNELKLAGALPPARSGN